MTDLAPVFTPPAAAPTPAGPPVPAAAAVPAPKRTLCVAHAEYDCPPCTETDRGFYPSAADLDRQHPAPVAGPGGSQLLIKGKIALFMLPDESLVIAFRPEGSEETRQQVIPGMALAAMAAMGGGTVPDLIAKFTEGLAG